MEFSESNVADRIKTSINSDFGQLEAEIAGMEADVNRSLSIFLEMCEGRRLERDAEKEAASCVWQALLMDIERKEEEIKAELERWSEAERARLAEERNRIVLEFQNLRASFALETMQDFSAAVGLISAQYMEAFRESVGNGRDPNETERLLSIAREIEIDWLSEICADDMQAHDIWLADAIAQMERDIDEDLRESIDRMNAEYAAFCRAQKAMAQQREVVVQYVTTVDPLQVFETKDEGRQQVDTVVQQVVANCERIAAEVDQQLTAAANVSPEMVGTLSQAVHSGVQAAANVAAQGAAVAINRGVEVIRDGGTPETAQQEIAAVGEEADRNMHLQEYGLMEGSRGGVRNAMVNALRRACAADAFRILGTRALFALAVGGIVVPGVAAGWAWWTGGVTAIRALLAVALAGHPVLGIGAAAVAYVGITSGVALYGSGQPHHDEQPHHDGE
jgi:hypothetical protein